jgi:hypothetical protein
MQAVSRRRESLPLILPAALLCGASIYGAVLYGRFVAQAPLPDFHAFYCAANMVAAHADPYRQQPLAQCEARFTAGYFPPGSNGLAIPAPLPGYALASILPLALLPFAAASAVWLAILAICMALTVAALRSLSGLPWPLLAAVTMSAEGVAAFALGQPVPIAGLGICGAALALRAKRPLLAAAACLPVWFVPQAALPLAAALFVCERRSRVAVLIQVALLAAAMIGTVGVPVALEYVTRVLPAQMHAELAYSQQIALAPELVQIGVPARIAIAAGTAVWIAACVAGIVLAYVRSRRGGDRAWIAVIPPVFSLLGGAYLHAHALALALPALAITVARPNGSRLPVPALLCLAIPWMPSYATVYLWPLFALAALLAADRMPAENALRGVTVAAVCALALMLLDRQLLTLIAARGMPAAIIAHVPAWALAERSWAVVVQSSWAAPVTSGVWAARAAALTGTIMLAVALLPAKLKYSQRAPI